MKRLSQQQQKNNSAKCREKMKEKYKTSFRCAALVVQNCMPDTKAKNKKNQHSDFLIKSYYYTFDNQNTRQPEKFLISSHATFLPRR